ncbi:MAG TPA: hypothetical protein VIL65_02270 [Beijerinckiaceae bacterium]|jgi:hypothetical protein
MVRNWAPERYPIRLGYMLGALEEFASEKLQERLWRGLGPEMSSYEEAYEIFLGDWDGDSLIDLEWREAGLTEVQRNALRAFRTALNAFHSKLSPEPNTC